MVINLLKSGIVSAFGMVYCFSVSKILQLHYSPLVEAHILANCFYRSKNSFAVNVGMDECIKSFLYLISSQPQLYLR